MIMLNMRDSRPFYEQVRDSLRELITSGVLAPGDKLPSVRELANSLTINPNTIQRAYRELESEGYIATQPGRGSFVLEGKGAGLARRASLWTQLDAIVAELRWLGVSEEELLSHMKEGENNG